MKFYSSHGIITSLAVIKELELERGNAWFDDKHLDLDKSRAVWVSKTPEVALRYLFPAGILEDNSQLHLERKQYDMALLSPESYVEAVELDDRWQEVLDDGDGGFLYILPSQKFAEMPSPIEMLADLEVHQEQPEIGKMIKPMSLVTYLGGKKKWIEVFEEDLLPLLHSRVNKPYAFLDCFGGSGIVSYTFRMGDFGDDVRKVYYNDTNEQMVNLLNCVKNKKDKMMQHHEAIATAFSLDPTQAGFQMLKDISDNDPVMARRAVAYIMRMKVSYMGKGTNIPKQDFTIPMSVRKAFGSADSIDSWHEAFQHAEIWQGEFDDAISRFEKSEGKPRVIFCDPPYLGHKASDSYAGGFDHTLHDRLAALIANRKSTYVLTHSYTPEFKALYAPVLKTRDWHMDVDVRYGNKGDTERQHETLSVWFAR